MEPHLRLGSRIRGSRHSTSPSILRAHPQIYAVSPRFGAALLCGGRTSAPQQGCGGRILLPMGFGARPLHRPGPPRHLRPPQVVLGDVLSSGPGKCSAKQSLRLA